MIDKELNMKKVPNKSLLIYLSKTVLKDQTPNMMDDLELYERARYCWRMNKITGGLKKINEYKYVFVCFKKHILTVYKNVHWFKAGTTQLFTRKEGKSVKGRYEFVGKIDEKLNKKFVGKYYFDNKFQFGGDYIF